MDGECVRSDAESVTAVQRPNADVHGDSRGAGGAIGGGVAMLLTGAVVLGLSTVSEVNRQQLVPALPIGILATCVFALAAPIWSVVIARNREARRVDGVGALRVVGWIGYPLTIVNALTLTLYAVSRSAPVAGHIMSVGILAFLSMTALAIDGFVSAGQERAGTVGTGRSSTRRSGFAAMPTVTFATSGNASTDFTLGFAGIF